MSPQALLARVREIILRPKLEWPKIAAEDTPLSALYTGYILWLAALPPLFGFVKSSMLGYGALGETLRIDPVHGATQMVLTYGVGVGVAYLTALIVNTLASGFGGGADPRRATQLAAYALTAHWMAGVGAVLPFASLPVLLLGWAYTGYLLYLGLPHLLRCPEEKSGAYAVTVTFLALVISFAGFTAARIVAGVNAALSGPSTFVSDRGTVRIDSPDSPLERAAALGAQLRSASDAASDPRASRAQRDAAQRKLEELVPREPAESEKPPED